MRGMWGCMCILGRSVEFFHNCEDYMRGLTKVFLLNQCTHIVGTQMYSQREYTPWYPKDGLTLHMSEKGDTALKQHT